MIIADGGGNIDWAAFISAATLLMVSLKSALDWWLHNKTNAKIAGVKDQIAKTSDKVDKAAVRADDAVAKTNELAGAVQQATANVDDNTELTTRLGQQIMDKLDTLLANKGK